MTAESDVNVARLGVLDDVIERFLSDAVECDLDGWVQGTAIVADVDRNRQLLAGAGYVSQLP